MSIVTWTRSLPARFGNRGALANAAAVLEARRLQEARVEALSRRLTIPAGARQVASPGRAA